MTEQDMERDDPRPEAPEPPADGECCESGCDVCVMDFYTEELHAYRAELAAWEARQVQRKQD
ncbi:MAG: oxidoreductase-like domain-containing protein [Pigmentiphaga sp.]